MRTTILITPVVLMLASGVAFAQSAQGGYLGKNPGANVDTASQDPVKAPPAFGSGRGGYLGAKIGENQPSASQDPVKPAPTQGSREGGYLGLTPGARK